MTRCCSHISIYACLRSKDHCHQMGNASPTFVPEDQHFFSSLYFTRLKVTYFVVERAFLLKLILLVLRFLFVAFLVVYRPASVIAK